MKGQFTYQIYENPCVWKTKVWINSVNNIIDDVYCDWCWYITLLLFEMLIGYCIIYSLFIDGDIDYWLPKCPLACLL